ncbi:hypothetical protein M433DRAFT_75580 [Acidomyces richmondensis BFW]|nr:hypothetical protein M433DRAFT_75580 [Acidomyces richmondensis BFW]
MLYLRLVQGTQAYLAGRGLYHSYYAIINLQKYEDAAKKLAEWSSEADRQLHKTRTTQASGAVTVFVSFLSAIVLVIFDPYVPPMLRFCISPILLIMVMAARQHIKNYWAPGDGKTVGTKIPLPKLEDYNEAQKQTEELLGILEYLEYGWLASSFVAGLMGWK